MNLNTDLTAIQETLPPEQAAELLGEFVENAMLVRLNNWRRRHPERGFAVHSLPEGKIGVRLYVHEQCFAAFQGRTLEQVVEALKTEM